MVLYLISTRPRLTRGLYSCVCLCVCVGQSLGLLRSQQALVELFNGAGAGSGHKKRRRLMTVLLVDEIDMLMTRDQSVLYSLFSWPHYPGARLAVIGIANTLDLPQRLLPKIARCALTHLVVPFFSRLDQSICTISWQDPDRFAIS